LKEIDMSSKWNFNVMNIFGLVMVAFYIAAGLYILLTHTFNYVPSEFRIMLGAFLILYGIFRFVRIFVKLKNPES
jgi:hypothetical protein